jgi:hypothetical protein
MSVTAKRYSRYRSQALQRYSVTPPFRGVTPVTPDVDDETLSDERDILLGRVVYAVAVWQQSADGGRMDAPWRRDLKHFVGRSTGNA